MGIFQTILIWVFIISLILSILYNALQWIFLYANDTWWDEMGKNVSQNGSMPLTKGQIMTILGSVYIVSNIFAVSLFQYHKIELYNIKKTYVSWIFILLVLEKVVIM